MKKIVFYLLFFLFGLVSLGQLERIELPLGRAFYLHEIVMLGFILLIAPFLIRSIRSKLMVGFVLINTWVIISILGTGLSAHLNALTPLLYLLRLDTYVLFGFCLFKVVEQKIITRKKMLWLTILSIAIVALLGWLQYVFIPDTRGLMFLGWDDHYLRLISTLFDPGFTGAILVIGSLIMQRRLFSHAARNAWNFALNQWLWVLMTGALLFTYSRASFLAFAVGSFYLYFREKRLAHLVVLGFLGLAVLCLPRPASEGTRLERTASISARVSSIKSGVGSLSPLQYLVGQGWYSEKVSATHSLSGSQVTSHNSAPDDSFIFIFTSLGLVGLALFAWFGWLVLAGSGWNSIIVCVLLAMSVHSFFSNTLFYPFVLFYLAAIVGSNFDPEV